MASSSSSPLGQRDVAIDPVGVRPVGLDRDGGEALLAISRWVIWRALAIELVRAVRRLADQHEPRVADRSRSAS